MQETGFFIPKTDLARGVVGRGRTRHRRQSPSIGIEQHSTFFALFISRCGAVATVQDGRLTGLKVDPSQPTGQALGIKGKVAPELVYHRDRTEGAAGHIAGGLKERVLDSEMRGQEQEVVAPIMPQRTSAV